MDDYICRGKRLSDGQYIEGYLIKLGKESFSDPDRFGICEKALPVGGSSVCYNLRIDEVDANSIGRFIGKNDKNGKKIFTGDYVKCVNYHGEVKGIVELYNAAFFLVCMSGHSDEYLFNCKDFEVLGVAAEMPELLEDDE